MGHRTRLISTVSVLLLAAGSAHAQDAQPFDSLTSAELFEFSQPELEGHVKGPRERPEPAPAEPTPPPAEEELPDWLGGKPWFQWSTMTGNWGGARTRFEDAGVSISGSYVADWGTVLSGGLNQVASSLHLWDLNTTFDLEKIAGLKGGTIFADAQISSVRGGSRDIGDFHGVSNIDTENNRGQISELWYEQWLFEDVARLKLGKIDANAEFGFVDAAGEALNGSMAMLLTTADMPTFPDPATGVVVFIYPTERCYLGGGFFDGATADGWNTGNRGPDQFFSNSKSDSWFLIAETGCTWDEAFSMGSGRIAIGIHHHTVDLPTFTGTDTQSPTGYYAILEQQLWRKGADDDLKEKGLFWFVSAGRGDEDVHEVEGQIATGLMARGVMDSRPDDSIGALFSWAALNDDAGFEEENEYVIEALYKAQFTPWFSVTPDLQYIVNPGGAGDVDDAVRLAARFELIF